MIERNKRVFSREKMFFKLPCEVLKIIQDYEENTMVIMLIFKKNRIDNLVLNLKCFDSRTERLQNTINMLKNRHITDLQHDEQLGEAFYSHFIKIQQAAELPDFIKNHIDKNKKQLKNAEHISKKISLEIPSHCTHKKIEKIDRYNYDEVISTDAFCCLCGKQIY